jgi:hypothetical protein
VQILEEIDLGLLLEPTLGASALTALATTKASLSARAIPRSWIAVDIRLPPRSSSRRIAHKRATVCSSEAANRVRFRELVLSENVTRAR